MLLLSQVVLFCLAIYNLRYLRMAWRRRVLSMIFLVLSVETLLFNWVCFGLYPASYWHYLWVGSLHIGPVTFHPPSKPGIDWISPLLLLLSFTTFYREEAKKKQRAMREQPGRQNPQV
jgi:hypothetical protein